MMFGDDDFEEEGEEEEMGIEAIPQPHTAGEGTSQREISPTADGGRRENLSDRTMPWLSCVCLCETSGTTTVQKYMYACVKLYMYNSV